MLTGPYLAALLTLAGGVHVNLPLLPTYLLYPKPFTSVLPVSPLLNSAPAPLTYNVQLDEVSGGHPLREAVESQPSDAVKAHTRMVDFLTKGACQEGTYTAAEGACQDYMFCVHGKPERQSCPSGLYWDSSANICNFPDAVDCKEDGGSRPPVVEAAPELPQEAVIAEVDNNPRPGDPDFVSEAPVSSTTVDWNKPWAPPTPPPRPDYDNLPLTNGLSGDYKIVCYFTNWATYRQGGDGKFDPEHIDPNICTHIVYGFAVLDQNTLLTKSHDPYADMSDGKFKLLFVQNIDTQSLSHSFLLLLHHSLVFLFFYTNL